MKVVKCVHESWSVPLTKGKIYEVIHFQTEWIRIINDHGNQEFYYIKDTDGTWFVDATADIREEKLKELGL
jgi:hypothetical protein